MAYIEIGSLIQTEADYENGGHVTAFPELAEEIVKVVENSFKATSSSTVAIGTGSKVFVTDVRVPWTVNTPLRAHDTVLDTKFLDGKITAITHTSTSSTITVSVSSSGDFSGSGSHSSWVLFPFTRTYTTVSSPVSISEGGGGGTTAEQNRDNWEVPRMISVIGIAKSPDPAAPIGSKTLIDSTGLGGAFVGHENEVGLKTGTSTYTFETVIARDLAIDNGGIDDTYRSAGYAGAIYEYTGSSTSRTLLSSNTGKWIYAGGNAPDTKFIKQDTISSNSTITRNSHGRLIKFTNTSNIAVTLEHDGTDFYEGVIYYLWHDGLGPGVGDVTLSIQGGQYFQYEVGGSASITSVKLVKGDFCIVVGINGSGSHGFNMLKSAAIQYNSGALNGTALKFTSDKAVGALATGELSWDAEVYDTVSAWSSGARVTVPAGFTKVKVSAQFQINAGSGFISLINVDNVNQYGLFQMALEFGGVNNTITKSTGWIPVNAGERLAFEYLGGGSGMTVESTLVSWATFEFM